MLDRRLLSRSRTLSRAALLTVFVIAASACSGAAGTPVNSPPVGDKATGTTAVAGDPAAGAPNAQAVGAPAQAGSQTGAQGATPDGGASSSAAIAYPVPGYMGTPGVAADHTIVVTGVGSARVKADGSDRARAQRNALAAALADAKAQADLVAETTGVTIHGVLSVSVASGQTWAYPMAAAAEGSAPGAATGGGAVTSPAPTVAQPVPPQLEVSVTVAYQFG